MLFPPMEEKGGENSVEKGDGTCVELSLQGTIEIIIKKARSFTGVNKYIYTCYLILLLHLFARKFN